MIKDLINYKNNSPSKSYMAVLLNPCYYSVILYRISNKLYRCKLFILAKIFWLINRIVFSIDIDYRAKIGENFMIVHGIGTVIGCDVEIGTDVKIYQGVTLGGDGRVRVYNNRKITQPIIKDKCIIYTNACIFGPVIVSENTKVKACKLVNEDI